MANMQFAIDDKERLILIDEEVGLLLNQSCCRCPIIIRLTPGIKETKEMYEVLFDNNTRVFLENTDSIFAKCKNCSCNADTCEKIRKIFTKNIKRMLGI